MSSYRLPGGGDIALVSAARSPAAGPRFVRCARRRASFITGLAKLELALHVARTDHAEPLKPRITTAAEVPSTAWSLLVSLPLGSFQASTAEPASADRSNFVVKCRH